MNRKIMGLLLIIGTSAALAGCAQTNANTQQTVPTAQETQSVQTTGSATQSSGITEDAAKAIALSDAGVQAADVTFTKVARATDDGYDKYEIEFHNSQTEYDYDIDAVSGVILGYSRETTENVGGTQDAEPATTTKSETQATDPSQQPAQPAETSGSAVTDQQALSLAISAAGVAQADVSSSRVKLDFDDDYGKQIYDVEFYVGRMEYSYDIDPDTGAILSSDSDLDD